MRRFQSTLRRESPQGQFDLSYLYPFEKLDRVLLAFAAWLILKEKMTRDLWIGVICICLGTVFVAGS